MEIRESSLSDIIEIKNIYLAAFGKDQGPIIAGLVTDLFKDKTAMPLLSLVAVENQKIIGHILFTKVHITPTKQPISGRILAPLAVSPEIQKSGIGKKLVIEGLNQLKQSGVELVFVLGHPEYYPRFGFFPAGEKGFNAPYPILDKNAAAWMVQELNGHAIGTIKGTVQCAKALDQPEHWQE